MHEFDDYMFDEFVNNNPNGNFMQSTTWARIKSDWIPHRFMWSRNGKPVAVVQFLSRRGLWYAPRGPVMDYADTDLVSDVLRDISLVTRVGGAKYVKIDPPVLIRRRVARDKSLLYSDIGLISQFTREGYIHHGFTTNLGDTIQPRHHMVVTLDREIPTVFPKKTRRLIRDAVRKYMRVNIVGTDGLDDFMRVIHATESKHNITLRNKEYFESIMNEFGEIVQLYLTTIDVNDAITQERQLYNRLVNERIQLGRSPKKYHQLTEQIQSSQSLLDQLNALPKSQLPLVACGALVIQYNDKKEILYAGMADEFSKFSGQYLEFATIMSDAKNQGFSEVSMGGVNGDLCDSLSGFKSKFDPDVIEYYGEFDKARNTWYKFIYECALPLYQKVRARAIALRKNF